jgi:predicted RNase H-like HicB family nuclease
MKRVRLTAVIEREGDGYVALCPEIDVASQGDTVDEARDNLHEAVDLFLECASESEISDRLPDEIRVETWEIIRQSRLPKELFEA